MLLVENNKPKWKGKHVMALKIQKVETWVAALEDKPGNLAAKLSALSKAGANLEFVLARRAPDKPGTGVVFVTPISGAAQSKAAGEADFRKTKSLHALRVEGPDRKGEGARMARALAEEGLNLRGLSAATIGKQFVAHIAVDTPAEVTKAARILRSL
jgi:hypothetical protein